MKKLVTLILVATMTLVTVGCYGSFGLTKKVYNLHGTIGDKWINSLIMFLVGHVVYGTTAFVDVVFLNAIEFWTGANPVASGDTLEQTDSAGNKVIATRLPGGALDMTVVYMDGTVKQMTLVNNNDAIVAYDADGRMLTQLSMAVPEAK